MNYFYLSENKEDLKTARNLAIDLLETVTDERIREKIQEDLWDLNDVINRDEPPVILEENIETLKKDEEI